MVCLSTDYFKNLITRIGFEVMEMGEHKICVVGKNKVFWFHFTFVIWWNIPNLLHAVKFHEWQKNDFEEQNHSGCKYVGMMPDLFTCLKYISVEEESEELCDDEFCHSLTIALKKLKKK